MTEQERNSPDEENPEWTPEDMRRARPASEVLPEIFGEQTAREMLRRGKMIQEGPQEPVPVDADIVRHFRKTGADWQTRINEALREWIGREGARRQ